MALREAVIPARPVQQVSKSLDDKSDRVGLERLLQELQLATPRLLYALHSRYKKARHGREIHLHFLGGSVSVYINFLQRRGTFYVESCSFHTEIRTLRGQHSSTCPCTSDTGEDARVADVEDRVSTTSPITKNQHAGTFVQTCSAFASLTIQQTGQKNFGSPCTELATLLQQDRGQPASTLSVGRECRNEQSLTHPQHHQGTLSQASRLDVFGKRILTWQSGQYVPLQPRARNRLEDTERLLLRIEGLLWGTQDVTSVLPTLRSSEGDDKPDSGNSTGSEHKQRADPEPTDGENDSGKATSSTSGHFTGFSSNSSRNSSNTNQQHNKDQGAGDGTGGGDQARQPPTPNGGRIPDKVPRAPCHRFPCVFSRACRQSDIRVFEHCLKSHRYVCKLRKHHERHGFFYCIICFELFETLALRKDHKKQCLPKCVTRTCINKGKYRNQCELDCKHGKNTQRDQYMELCEMAQRKFPRLRFPGDSIPDPGEGNDDGVEDALAEEQEGESRLEERQSLHLRVPIPARQSYSNASETPTTHNSSTDSRSQTTLTSFLERLNALSDVISAMIKNGSKIDDPTRMSMKYTQPSIDTCYQQMSLRLEQTTSRERPLPQAITEAAEYLRQELAARSAVEDIALASNDQQEMAWEYTVPSDTENAPVQGLGSEVPVNNQVMLAGANFGETSPYTQQHLQFEGSDPSFHQFTDDPHEGPSTWRRF